VSVRIERAGNRILLASERPTPGLKHEIPGAYFRKDKVWSLPLDLPTCIILREKFGSRLEIGPALTAWARAEKAQRATQKETAAAYDADLSLLPEVAPVLAKAMGSRTYQRAAARFVADSRSRDGRRRALIGDTVGLGKTAEAMAAVLESGVEGPYLIVCPKTAVDVAWTPEFSRWLPGDVVITIPDSDQTINKVKITARERRDAILNDLLSRSATSLARTWVVIHPAAVRTQTWMICASCGSQTKFRSGLIDYLDCGHEGTGRRTVDDSEFPQLFGIQWGAVIADESDQMLIKKTGTPNLQRRGMELLRDNVKEGGVRLAMSGTPFRSKPHQIWSTLNWLDPVRFGSKWNFLGRFWKLGGYSGYEIGDAIPERDAMLVDELSDIMIRRSREEVRGDLPAKLYPDNRFLPADEALPVGIYLNMSLKQQRAYKAMEQTASADIEGGEVTAIGILAELTRLKQFAGAVGAIDPETGEFMPKAEGNKFDWLVAFLRELGLPGTPATKVIIVSQFTKLLNVFAEGIAKELKLDKDRYTKITGDVSGAARPVNVAAFEDVDSGVDLMYLNTKAGGSAITLDAAEITIIIDETWVDDEQQQVEGRSDNRNPERKIAPRSYYYLRSYGTVEEGIAIANAAAKARSKSLLDGGRAPVELAKSLLNKARS
jgi:SNF2 family DNA or RNA helicase